MSGVSFGAPVGSSPAGQTRGEAPAPAAAQRTVAGPRRERRLFARPVLIVGLVLVLGPLIVSLIAKFFVSGHGLDVFAANPSLSPSSGHLLGTDTGGRDVFTSLVYGTVPTYQIGLIGGAAGTAIGTIVGIVAAYFGGAVDTFLRGISDVLIGIPPIAILIVVTVLYNVTSVNELGLLVAVVGWPLGARGIRSQVLSLRERSFVVMARLSGRSAPGIMFAEILPNISALVAANLVGGIFGSLGTAIALQLLGLGPTTVPSWGLTLQQAITGGSLSQGLWWWWASPAILLILLFLGLLCLTLAVDVIANPRLRRERARG
jgi:peptide/nickel transport system permease protein